MVKAKDDEGRELDAEFSLAVHERTGELTVESRGGRDRNPDYALLMELLLVRLAAASGVIGGCQRRTGLCAKTSLPHDCHYRTASSAEGSASRIDWRSRRTSPSLVCGWKVHSFMLMLCTACRTFSLRASCLPSLLLS